MDGKILFDRNMSYEEVKAIYEISREANLPIIYEGTNYQWLDREGFDGDGYISYIVENLGDVAVFLDECNLEDIHANKFSALINENTDYEGIKESLSDSYDLLDHGDGIIEAVPKGTSKATGIKWLCEHLGISVEDTYAIGDLATAGCTISIGDFVAALEKAVANAADSKATADDKLNLAIVSSATNKDAVEDAAGSVEISSTIVAAVVDAEGKVVVSKTDSVSGKNTFDAKGVATVDTKAAIKTKVELGADYGMAAYGKKHDGSEGAVKEWYEQAAAFDATLVGKTASDFAALAGEDTYAIGDLAAAGCTISVGDMIAAAEKATK